MTTVRDAPQQHLFAQSYLALGYAVIPVYDNKVAAVEWKLYQRRRPTKVDLDHWFIQQQHTNVAIITGTISQLVVLDFDDPRIFQQFESRCSDLVDTRTIQTKRGYHLYFHLPPQLSLFSRKQPGVDLLANGKYVIAPPSTINGYVYKVTRGGQPRTLNAYDITRIEKFLDSLIKTQSEIPPEHLEHSSQPIVSPLCKSISSESSVDHATSSDLVALYLYLAPREGRNNALFKASLWARDTGWNMAQAVTMLADVHVQQYPNGNHQLESSYQRQREAIYTIRSAFSRPPRATNVSEPTQLPNIVREAFLGIKQTYTIRVIEGLRLQGIQPGQFFTAKQAVQLLKGFVGRDSVYKALNACINPSPRTLTHANAAKHKNNNQTTNCFVVTSSKSVKSPKHRPERTFIMPGNADLAAKLGVNLSRISDPITEEDIQSAKKTRQAVHRELVKRRPGRYSAPWLAERLGVSVVTEQRYNREIPITVVPMYTEVPLFWWNLAQIPVDMDIPGLFLQDEKGKRYPAHQSIACKLLGKGQRVSLMRRGCNYYCYGEIPPSVVNIVIHHKQQLLTFKSEGIYIKPYLTSVSRQRDRPPQTTLAQHEHGSITESTRVVCRSPSTVRKFRKSQRKYHKPLEDAEKEALAQRVYALIGSLNPGNRVSEINARKLVDQYGTQLVERALNRVGRDRRIHNPAGFIITYLQSEAKGYINRRRDLVYTKPS